MGYEIELGGCNCVRGRASMRASMRVCVCMRVYALHVLRPSRAAAKRGPRALQSPTACWRLRVCWDCGWPRSVLWRRQHGGASCSRERAQATEDGLLNKVAWTNVYGASGAAALHARQLSLRLRSEVRAAQPAARVSPRAVQAVSARVRVARPASPPHAPPCSYNEEHGMRPNTVFTVVDRCDPAATLGTRVHILALRRLKLTTAIMEGDEQVGGAGLSESLLLCARQAEAHSALRHWQAGGRRRPPTDCVLSATRQ